MTSVAFSAIRRNLVSLSARAACRRRLRDWVVTTARLRIAVAARKICSEMAASSGSGWRTATGPRPMRVRLEPIRAVSIMPMAAPATSIWKARPRLAAETTNTMA